MAKVGDSINLQIHGAPDTGTGLVSGGTTVTISPGTSMVLQGTIVGDRGDHWVVELNVSFGETNIILVSKESEGAYG